ncbi:MAG: 5-demethoxyubiquinol-8 5-hydroxylase UbiM [Pseudopelagicola sp.]|nr:5-demethoxyubiquinol-8 5-hydroxylase UbiM [Pseudopelagicola sp.]
MADTNQFDIIVVGAGPAGLGFARAMQGSGQRVAIVERLAESVLANPPEDGRDIALTHSSEALMREFDMWDRLDATRLGMIRDAKVLNGASPFALNFESQKAGAAYLGRIVPNHEIRRTAYEVIRDDPGVTLFCAAEVASVATDAGGATVGLADGRRLHGKLLIAADSRFSGVRRKMGLAADSLDFGRVVIVCEMAHDLPHGDTAYECFHYDQTLAILPMAGHVSSVVVTLPADRAEQVMAMSDDAFAADVAARFEGRLGAMRLSSPRHPYPLVAVLARRFVGHRFALVGDAAVGMHPVTAHGYNLGLSGASLLATEIRAALERGGDAGDIRALTGYERAHRRTVLPLYHGTNTLVRLFTDDRPPARLLRGAALRLGTVVKPVHNRILHKLTDIEAHVR